MTKDLQCPVCGRQAGGRKAEKRVKKWLQDSRLDRFMFDRLMTLIKAKMYSGEVVPPQQQTPEKEAAAAELKLRRQIRQELWGDKKPPAPGFKEVPPTGPPTEKQLAEADGLRQQWQQRKKVRTSDRRVALREKEAEQRKLKNRLYYRNYYHKNKAHIDALRKKRLAARSNGA